MTLLQDLFPTTPIKIAKNLINDKTRKIVEKGKDLSTVDLYNLCLLNKERAEIDNKEE